MLVGVQKARKIAGKFNLPIVGVHHMEAHALVARCLNLNTMDSVFDFIYKFQSILGALSFVCLSSNTACLMLVYGSFGFENVQYTLYPSYYIVVFG